MKTETDIDNVAELPMEDTIWILEEKLYDCIESDLRYMAIVDKSGHYIGSSLPYQTGLNTLENVQKFICHCMMHPEFQKPRRPKLIVIKSGSTELLLENADLRCQGINVYKSGQPILDMGIVWKECSSCHIRGQQNMFENCSSCHAVMYCGSNCKEKDYHAPHQPLYAHKSWCIKMKQYMEQEQQLMQLPFSYAAETTSTKMTDEKLKSFLIQHNIHNRGLWTWELTKEATKAQCSDALQKYVLPSESLILVSEVIREGVEEVKDWQSYYCHRGFSLSSPIAILLHWPLTIWYIIQHCLHHDYRICPSSPTLEIHMVGVEGEVLIMPVFEELGKLLPDKVINISMFGRHFPRHFHGRVYKYSNVTVTVYRKLYHKVSVPTTPHLVIGFNAGIVAYQSWLECLCKLKSMEIPTYFTDFCSLTIDISKLIVRSSLDMTLSDPIVNPFRSPIRKTVSDDNLPRLSNGFIFHVIYPDEQSCTS